MTEAWTRRTTRGKESAFVGEWSLSARAVDEDAEESLARVADNIFLRSSWQSGVPMWLPFP